MDEQTLRWKDRSIGINRDCDFMQHSVGDIFLRIIECEIAKSESAAPVSDTFSLLCTYETGPYGVPIGYQYLYPTP